MKAIDADALQKKLTKKKPDPANARYTEGFNDALLRFKSMIHAAPPIEPERKWIPMEVYVVIYEFVDVMLICDQVFHKVLGVFSSMEAAIDCVERDMKEVDKSIDEYTKEVYGSEVTYTNDDTTYQITKFVVDSFDN